MRDDIQFLRGVAVLLVVVYHSGLNFVPFGFLGVDVFFVISGFLITSHILKKLDANDFSFVAFYLKRANRLLPALYSTLLFTAVIGPFFLTSTQWEDFMGQFLGAVTFSANMVLPGQAGYFDAASETKPLLHIWSLSLEEQFYFLLPLCLFITPRRFRLPVLIALFIGSIGWCFNWVYSHNQNTPFLWRIADAEKFEWAFFLLPTRMWELLAGSIAAYLMLRIPHIHCPRYVKFLALTTLIAFTFFNVTITHPSIDAAVVVLCTATMLIGRNEWLPRFQLVEMFKKIGDWSYSIYLVHWPLYCFAYLAYVGDIPELIKFTLVFLSIFIGFIQYKYVEVKFRTGNFKYVFRNWKAVAASITIGSLIPFVLSSHPIYQRQEIAQEGNYGLSRNCQVIQGTIAEECKTAVNPTVAVWGDSYAMHLIDGLKVINDKMVQITMPACGPFLNLAFTNVRIGEQWAQKCISYNQAALEFIKNTESIESVVLSSKLEQYLVPGNLVFANEQNVNNSFDYIVNSFKSTVKELEAANKKVIFVTPTPSVGIDIYECIQREKDPVVLMLENCFIEKAKHLEYQKEVFRLIERFKENASLLRLDQLLCDETFCEIIIDDVLLYKDAGHLSRDGVKKILGNIALGDVN
jgi:peptidoglycan/LPS O-acetylase OafA/YrhL